MKSRIDNLIPWRAIVSTDAAAISANIIGSKRQLGLANNVRMVASELLLTHDVREGSALVVLDQLEEVFARAEGSEARTALQRRLERSAGDAKTLFLTAQTFYAFRFSSAECLCCGRPKVLMQNEACLSSWRQ